LDFVSLNNDIDYGCHPVVMPAGGEHKLHALLSDVQLDHFKRSLGMTTTMRVEALDHINKRQAATAPIGKGDRFKGGKVAPRGLGSRQPDEYASFETAGILNADEVYTAMKGLEKEYGMQLFEAPLLVAWPTRPRRSATTSSTFTSLLASTLANVAGPTI
jgi:hypothetical protein